MESGLAEDDRSSRDKPGGLREAGFKIVGFETATLPFWMIGFLVLGVPFPYFAIVAAVSLTAIVIGLALTRASKLPRI